MSNAVEHGTMDYVRRVLVEQREHYWHHGFETYAVLAGWKAARDSGIWDIQASDTIAIAAAQAVWDRMVEFFIAEKPSSD